MSKRAFNGANILPVIIQAENLYTSLLRKTDNALQNEGEVKAVVSELISTRSSADKSLKNMKAVFLDAANVPADKLHKRKKTKRQQLRDRPLNARERRTLKVYEVPRDVRYEWFIPLHDLWQGYMKDLYGQGPDIQQFAQKLLKADFHGSILTVTRSTNPSYVGSTGIVVQETLNLFKIVTKDNRLKRK
ncbi:RNase P/RNase MRP complex subunit [Apophysomyces ossiformis]|uniref:RNase P/RNase MRP complex subunit n=1 Tax=Apophysomyces ossiformis TaxID=679940 RepID=A0A8H7ENE3_9FUNG|nr:RNase P/RNase MRP complex subunit [Apophysomyces ossiformis]